jgi:hypothetical protein
MVIEYQYDQPRMIIGRIAWEPGDGHPYVITNTAYGHEIFFPCVELEEPVPNEWRGVFPTDLERPTSFYVRPTVESDAVQADTMAEFIRVPMPISVISYFLESNGEFVMPTLYALSDDDGFVITMMLDSEAGLYIRMDSAWHLLTNDDVVDGLNVIQVTDAALDLFDQFDRAGQLVAVSVMEPVGDGLRALNEPVAPAVAAAMLTSDPELVKDVPMFASADDLDTAIQAAQQNPELQWWVERRVKALGIEADLPWQPHGDA